MQYQQGFPSPPPNTYLDEAIANAKDSAFKQRLYDAAPNLNLLGLRFGGGTLSSEDKARAAQLGISTSAIESPDLFSFGKWKALDEIKPKEQMAMSQLPAVKAAENRQIQLQQYQLDREQDLQKDNAQLKFGFDMNLNRQNLEARANELQEQGKLNLRQAMLNSATNRQGSRMWM